MVRKRFCARTGKHSLRRAVRCRSSDRLLALSDVEDGLPLYFIEYFAPPDDIVDDSYELKSKNDSRVVRKRFARAQASTLCAEQ